MDFKGKTVLVTGGSRGIGRAIAIAFADHGARVAISYISNDKAADETLNGMPGGPHLKIKADICSVQDTINLVDSVMDRFGSLDILVNNAGVYIKHPVINMNFDDWQSAWKRTMDVNLTGPANLCYHAARQMIKQGGGKIINISSRGAFRGEPEYVAYGASKAGLNSMSQSLAKELAPFNIYVGVIAPGFVETDMAKEFLEGPVGEEIRNQSPLKRAAKPEEIAHAVLMFAAAGAEYMTGAIIDVNGASYLRS
jgi:NAD(P)-dependent dehydrogenase (short-subunit alcohol dehydrogenase family)